MKKILFTISILLPLFALSQKATINNEIQTVTLDKEKTIDVAKIIKNEEALRAQIDGLKNKLIYLSSEIDKIYDGSQIDLRRFNELSLENDRITSEMNELATEIERIRKEPNIRVYSYASISLSQIGYKAVDFGLALSSKKSLFTLTADPFSENFIIFSLGYGVKLF